MSALEDEVQGVALATIGGVVALLLAGLLGGLAWRSLHRAVPPEPPPTALVRFAPADDSLPSEALEPLNQLSDTLRADGSIGVAIGAVLAMGSDPALAQRRVARVHHALESNGVAAAQLTVSPARRSTGVSDERVELRLQ